LQPQNLATAAGAHCRTSIRTNFTRPDAPALIDTSDLRHWKCFATSAISSSFALPSTGGDLTWASHIPSSLSSRTLTRELGFTFTWMTFIRLICGWKPHRSKQRLEHRIAPSRYLESRRDPNRLWRIHKLFPCYRRTSPA